ncbi:MAG TPA: tRNA preQ1(34) S-adenosylmethionine ribosyltransferase-isomerase QueA [Anaerolineales bacterium]|nr:tRNA preQ1(34) S-adenosylmethionine ribosyltransferase-isomerase QueA [Anaerolineales bacterium]
MRTDDFDYLLPPERIAQHPARPRDHSRLMVLDRRTDALQHSRFDALPSFLHREDLLVLNETRVLPARLHARKLPTGGRAEILLLKRVGDRTWEALVGGRGLGPGRRLKVDGGPTAFVEEDLGNGRRRVRFDEPISPLLEQIGEMPVPPYIHERLTDPEDYQTVYSRTPGSAAAPTAGLHFTPNLLERIEAAGASTTFVTLHVGLDTFAPVEEQDPSNHHIHTEWCRLTAETADRVRAARSSGGRVIAVGTTSVRTLETAARAGELRAFEGPTDLFILPGFEFRAVDALITNFHLPRSTLLMLVSAFAGLERIQHAYDVAIREGYRFYSFGDAMFIQ